MHNSDIVKSTELFSRKTSLRSVVVLIAAITALFVLSSLTSSIFVVSGAYRVTSGATSGCSVTSGGQEEKYISTYAINANNHQQAYAITGAVVFKNIVGSANKVYLFVYIHPATTLTVSTTGATSSCSTMLSQQTDNIYWDAQNGIGGRNFATVGGDLVTDTATGAMLYDQYINVNANPGQTTAPLAAATGPSCSVSTSGQNRNSVYMLFIDDTNKQHAYVIKGSGVAQFSSGGVQSTSYYVYLSTQEIGAGTSPGSGSCSMNLSHGASSFEWAIRAPPSGSYGIYGTLGAACPPSGSAVAGLIDQFIDAKYQF